MSRNDNNNQVYIGANSPVYVSDEWFQGRLILIACMYWPTNTIVIKEKVRFIEITRVCVAETVLSPNCAIITDYEIQIHGYELNINLIFNLSDSPEFKI